MTNDTLTVHQRVAAVLADLDHIAKQRSRGVNYEFRSIDALMNKLHGPLAKHGVFLSTETVDYDLQPVEASNNRTAWLATGRIKVTAWGSGGDSVVLGVAGFQSLDYGDKAIYQAEQNATKYALLRALCIPIDEPDMDGRQPDPVPALPVREEAPRAASKAQVQKARILLGERGVVRDKDDSVYRAAMKGLYGVESVKDLNATQVSGLIDALENGSRGRTPEQAADSIIAAGVKQMVEDGVVPPAWVDGE